MLIKVPHRWWTFGTLCRRSSSSEFHLSSSAANSLWVISLFPQHHWRPSHPCPTIAGKTWHHPKISSLSQPAEQYHAEWSSAVLSKAYGAGPNLSQDSESWIVLDWLHDIFLPYHVLSQNSETMKWPLARFSLIKKYVIIDIPQLSFSSRTLIYISFASAKCLFPPMLWMMLFVWWKGRQDLLWLYIFMYMPHFTWRHSPHFISEIISAFRY